MSSSTGGGNGEKRANSSSGSPADKAGEKTSASISLGGGQADARKASGRDWSSLTASRASSSAGGDRVPGTVLGKRLASSVDEAMAESSDRRNLRVKMSNTNDIRREVDMSGKVVRFESTDPTQRGGTLVTPNPTRSGAVDIAFDCRDPTGYAVVREAAKSVGTDRMLMTIQPIHDQGERGDVFQSAYRKPLRPVDIDLTGDDDTASVASAATTSNTLGRNRECEACGGKKHKTGVCHKASSRDHRTVICPFHGVSAHGRGHNLDGVDPKGGNAYCSILIGWELKPVDKGSLEANRRLRLLFTKLVVERRRKPMVRVVKPMYCPIRIAIDYSDACCNGEMPPELEGAWPYTRKDLQDKGLVEKLNSMSKFNWRKMQPGELEGMSWDTIKQEYGASIPKQCTLQKEVEDGENEVMEDAPATENPGSDTITGDGQGGADAGSDELDSLLDSAKRLIEKAQQLRLRSGAPKEDPKATATAGTGSRS
ncbi:hypothetical protein KVR01_004718 [Diaporthe batatas]|uniref:uncharacterized protein n=1 Tax=Diaporthe batatas TaxID=748121 RepID=UPI001D040485|nr:uncharacterized protein KVR01_004718 [Diaporthe batatas]KAG8166166.1 hypothetical protein KVR01_004718 [Diaporthe batatas]